MGKLWSEVYERILLPIFGFGGGLGFLLFIGALLFGANRALHYAFPHHWDKAEASSDRDKDREPDYGRTTRFGR